MAMLPGMSTQSVPDAAYAPRTIGADLERVRLEHRARRIDHVLTALRERQYRDAVAGRRQSGVPRLMEDFTAELQQVRGRLMALDRRGR
ncbi:hypothetical protein PAI11_05510 [Patulibacter medicamentivorans]|uniref:Uncharacterized protein n=2 Tax=Patulibacter medicamentivorans TaxID=1097667 RepID=H0E189_9ACTN|nr:hypothetical protein PAI11_05510 [Patulibacter medicamentivorans]